jgi:hypothetical protein
MSVKEKIKELLNKGKDKEVPQGTGSGINICIACFPKSGSTYLSKLLSAYTGFQRVDYVHAWGRREQEWEKDIVEKMSGRNVIVQQHTRGSEATLKLIQKYNIRTIVLVRNIYDVLPSLKDHIFSEKVEVPGLYYDESHLSLSDEQFYDLLVDMMGPWYISFYAMWFYQCKKHGIPMLAYEDYFSNEEQEFGKLCGLLGLDYSADRFKAALADVKGANTRFNVGKAGRGISLLSQGQKERIKKFASYYPDCDFSLIGIH